METTEEKEITSDEDSEDEDNWDFNKMNISEANLKYCLNVDKILIGH